ncbi:iron-sulfur cluster protein ISCU [Toxoplasma gondii FOU]|uniref:Iron-sulfur cluster protein ISCU n=3 Tax=Toxoplasma gondii TaxID=5811 RepID=A0A086KIV1_TOXGO|nr:iron-sulfur cluster protein ISCU [Toxoplasma gondii FOU]PUA86494.1 iron-sulfur cluster protein ISCU [Toxoplasma gondii TgCATBr9]RQX70052.1 iron-sulfur cluster protein ISCU [Toxoplasma gondii CAST]
MALTRVRPLFCTAEKWTFHQSQRRFVALANPCFLSTAYGAGVSAFAKTSQLQGFPRLGGQQQLRRYSKKVHEHFFNPKNAGAFDLSDPETRSKVGTAVVGKAACGDVIKLQVLVEDGKIRDARFKTFGCGSAIASSSYATELIKGKTCDDALKLKNTDIAEYLNLPPVKVHCSLLAEDAVRHAILDYQKKQKTTQVSGSSTMDRSAGEQEQAASAAPAQ